MIYKYWRKYDTFLLYSISHSLFAFITTIAQLAFHGVCGCV